MSSFQHLFAERKLDTTSMSRDEPGAPQSIFNPSESSIDASLSQLFQLNKKIICPPFSTLHEESTSIPKAFSTNLGQALMLTLSVCLPQS